MLVEDEENLHLAIKLNLELENYNVTSVYNGKNAISKLRQGRFDLIILDVMLPEMNGFDICESIRLENSKVPILFLTAKSSNEDKLIGLRIADDYLTKPFNLKELMLRVEAVIRRSYPEKFAKSIDYKDISIDLKSHKVFRSKAEIKLSPKEFDLLKHFLINPKQVFSREQLLDKIWGVESDIELRTVDVHIRRLRKAVNIQGCREVIRTVRSTGYSLD